MLTHHDFIWLDDKMRNAKKIVFRTCVLLASIVVAGVCFLSFPFLCPTLAWKTGNPHLQELAIPRLMKRLHEGMSRAELIRTMGQTAFIGTNALLGVECLSYNVNFEYNVGIDIEVKDGKVVSVFEYN